MTNNTNPINDLEAHFDAVMRRMPATFTSHDFIRALEAQDKPLYDQAVKQYEGSADALRTVHVQIAQRLAKRADVTQLEEKTSSTNARGNESMVTQWRKK